ncbi:hypothetical protein OESDEN_22256 [Oesophagostomum dentatum]|uniref:Uncharacterized protein n=1 Tax=Oesophagostomum dentatum TaxID=61180 RepID=A0A0B1RZP7_OESDE|nr:hypothetical protein OESDEN_22256 [Oesophagostomum dentatum]
MGDLLYFLLASKNFLAEFFQLSYVRDCMVFQVSVMKEFLLILLLLTLTVCDHQNCDKETECPKGSLCRKGICTPILIPPGFRCPMYVPARPPPGCRVVVTKDERNCRHPRIVCDKD